MLDFNIIHDISVNKNDILIMNHHNLCNLPEYGLKIYCVGS